MASPNESPAFSKASRRGQCLVTAANTSSQGGGTIGTDIFLVLTADPTNGTLIPLVQWIPTATAPTNTQATVGRLFVSSQSSGVTTNANTFLLREITLPLVAADNATTQVNPFPIPFNFSGSAGLWLPPGSSLLATNHAAPAVNTAWSVQVFGLDY